MSVLDALPLDGIVDAFHRSLISDTHRTLRLRLSNRHGALESVPDSSYGATLWQWSPEQPKPVPM